jgi:hypothetical protein
VQIGERDQTFKRAINQMLGA